MIQGKANGNTTPPNPNAREKAIKATPKTVTGLALNLSSTPGWSVINPTETSISGLDCPVVLVCNLYRNNIPVNNPDVQTLVSGVYNYVYNTSEIRIIVLLLSVII